MGVQKRYGMVIDVDVCIGCKACELACRQEHNLRPRVGEELDFKQHGAPFWMKINWAGPYGTFPDLSFFYYASMCAHCEDAPCVVACETGTLQQREDGIVLINDESKCDGCGNCAKACPYPDVIWIDPDTHRAEKCTFCYHRVEDGREPACVAYCPMKCLTFGDLNDPESDVSKKLKEKDVMGNTIKIPVAPHMEVNPSRFYVLRRGQGGHFDRWRVGE
jgi:Fe-S-cluster-containing dehydrogenase component